MIMVMERREVFSTLQSD